MAGHLLQLHEAAPSINYYDMLCSFCKRSMLFCVCVFFSFVISASKFSRSPYLDIYILTRKKFTLEALLLFYGICGSTPGVGARKVKI